jgi:hypothetical protein
MCSAGTLCTRVAEQSCSRWALQRTSVHLCKVYRRYPAAAKIGVLIRLGGTLSLHVRAKHWCDHIGVNMRFIPRRVTKFGLMPAAASTVMPLHGTMDHSSQTLMQVPNSSCQPPTCGSCCRLASSSVKLEVDCTFCSSSCQGLAPEVAGLSGSDAFRPSAVVKLSAGGMTAGTITSMCRDLHSLHMGRPCIPYKRKLLITVHMRRARQPELAASFAGSRVRRKLTQHSQ